MFDVDSGPEGSVILARVSPKGDDRRVVTAPFTIGGVSVPKDGEILCGDGWGWDTSESMLSVVVADGLGHGYEAHEAARAAVAISPRVNGGPACQDWLERIHAALSPT